MCFQSIPKNSFILYLDSLYYLSTLWYVFIKLCSHDQFIQLLYKYIASECIEHIMWVYFHWLILAPGPFKLLYIYIYIFQAMYMYAYFFYLPICFYAVLSFRLINYSAVCLLLFYLSTSAHFCQLAALTFLLIPSVYVFLGSSILMLIFDSCILTIILNVISKDIL